MFGEQLVDTGGLKVVTTLDWDKQQYAEEAVIKLFRKVVLKLLMQIMLLW
jgi:membrane carboxypeptidase/penicillin-binding protein